MANLKSLPENAILPDLMRAYPRIARLALPLAQEILRGPGELTPAQREFLFAFGSGLNACHFCHGAHTAVAAHLGVPRISIDGALEDIDTARVDERFKALLHYVKKLTQTPSRVSEADADAVRAAGWSDDALHEAVTVCALNNFFNRWVDGSGVDAEQSFLDAAGAMLADSGYLAGMPPE
ncbi:MAG: carboxymuconolactone decarboxylase family protein [Immundisolibacter sp.]|uniref:carboxymuconolactone decarboxylase family protein n=1 Tax=Immundisolibacter sp. TaxID=1934948 RepID=UPI003EDF6C5E